MALTGAAARAERILLTGLAQADANVSLRSKAGRAEAREILEMLERADEMLRRRLEREARRFGPTERFTGAGLLAYRRQVQTVQAFVRARMDGHSRKSARANVRIGWDSSVSMLSGLEEAFSGSVRPLRINSARMMNERTRGVRASLLRQHATSMDRYGEEMERSMRQTLQGNLLAGGSFSQAVDQLVAMRGPRGEVSVAARELPDGTVQRTRLETIPEGLFRKHRWWAMRIVRTETAYAQNASAHEALRASRDLDFPDMQKKILAMMDNRTYPDSIAVHGQIRDVDALFRDGAGREYLHPPARPNDREVVIPWRPGWDEVPTSEPRTSLEEAIERAKAAANTETLPQDETARLLRETPLHERLVREEGPHGLGGAGQKRILVDPVTGQRFLFKVAQAKSGGGVEEFRARAQEAFSTIAQRVRPGHVNVETMTHEGQIGTLQPMLELGDPPDFRKGRIAPASLSSSDALQVAEEHVLDWALSQHDTHSENLVRTADGRILSIDKEQGWRYFGDADEELSTSYAPNRERYGEEDPYYNRFWREFEVGRVNFDPTEMRGTFDRLDAISTEDLRASIAPYAAVRPGLETDVMRTDFVDRAVQRIRNTRSDFEDFIEDRYTRREGRGGTFTLEEGWVPDPIVVGPYSSPDVDDATNFARDALRSGNVPEISSPHSGSNQEHAGVRARRLRGLRRVIAGEDVGQMADAMIDHWAGVSTDGAAALVSEALQSNPDDVALGWWPRPRAGVANDEHHRALISQGRESLNGKMRFAGGRRDFEGTDDQAVGAATTQLAATRALLEHEGISQPGQTTRVLRGLDRGLADTVRELVREAKASGASHIRVPTRALASTALFSETSSTRSGHFGPVVLDVDVPHEGIFSHYDIDGELLSGESEIVAIFPDGHIEVAVNRVYDRRAGDSIPRRNQAAPPAPAGTSAPAGAATPTPSEPDDDDDDVNPLDILLGGGP